MPMNFRSNIKTHSTLFACLIFCSGHAQSVTFGPVVIKSRVGEPLSAEIEIYDFSDEDLLTFKAQQASRSLYAQSSLQPPSSTTKLNVQVQKNTGGYPVIQLSTANPLNQQRLDVLLETKWATGATTFNCSLDIADKDFPLSMSSQESASSPSLIKDDRLQTVSPPESVLRQDGRHLVLPGETSSGIIASATPPGVTQDQMLLALAQMNPEAFIEGNVNLILAGSRIQIPAKKDALQFNAEDARKTVAMQALQFGNILQRLALKTFHVGKQIPNEHSGVVARNESLNEALPLPMDKLTLSKGSAASLKQEIRIAHERDKSEKNKQIDALNENLTTLKNLAASSLPMPNAVASTSSDKTRVHTPEKSVDPSFDWTQIPLIAIGAAMCALMSFGVITLWRKKRTHEPLIATSGLTSKDAAPRKNEGAQLGPDGKNTDHAKIHLAAQIFSEGEIDLARTLLQSVADKDQSPLRIAATRALHQIDQKTSF